MATERSAKVSQLIAGVMTFVVAIFAILYLCAVYWSYRLMMRTPRPLNKAAGVRLQRYAPGFYAFLVLLSLSVLGMSSWLLAQYNFNHNSPNDELLTGLKLTTFASSWTYVTGSLNTVLFVHPVWSTSPVSSIGVQAIWTIATWSIWVASASLMNSALPALFSRGVCFGLVYCRQIQAVYALAVLEVICFAAGMLTIMWLVWRSTRDILLPPVQAVSS